jgi:pimeloyl-ACP methyl ester carboxylesterase
MSQTTPVRVWALRTAFRTVGTVAPNVAARWAETIFCTPPRHTPPEADEEFVATGNRFMVRSEGQEIAGWEWGSGPTVLLVHGWGSRAGRFRGLATELLSHGFRVVAHDAPAHGRSTGRFASLPEFARALRAVADRSGAIHGVVGHSLGGAAACLALRGGLGARRLVLVAPPADVGEFSQNFGDYLRIPARARIAMRRNLETRLSMRWEDLHIPTIARAIDLPALVVHDREDTEVGFAHGEEIARAFPRGRLLATTGLGHRAILRDPGVVRETVGFLLEERGT